MRKWSCLFLLTVALAAWFLKAPKWQESQTTQVPRSPLVEVAPLTEPGTEHAPKSRTRVRSSFRRTQGKRPPSRPVQKGPVPARTRPQQLPVSRKQTPKPKSYPKAKARPKPSPPVEIANHSLPARTSAPMETGNTGDDLRLKAEVSWDSLPASGPPMNGHFQFEIKANARQKKNEVKRNLVVLLDVSGSMRLPIKDVMNPVILLMSRLGPDDRGKVVTFSDKTKTFAASTPMSTYQREIAPLVKARRTNLLVGLKAAVKELRKGRVQGRSDQLVVLTDGLTVGAGGKDGLPTHYQECLKVCVDAGVPVTVFGYGASYNEELLRSLAQGRGGKFTYSTSVRQLLDSVMGDVIGLSGTITQNNRLIVVLRADVKVKRVYLLGPKGKALGSLRVDGDRLVIPLGKLSEGETIKVAIETVLPSAQAGTVELAEAQIEYRKSDGTQLATAPAKVSLKYTESGGLARRNPATGQVLSEIQKVRR